MRRTIVLVTALAVLGGCASDGEPQAGTTTTTTARTLALGPSVDLGDGSVAGAHPRLALAYLSLVDAAAGGTGCEGGDVTRLWARPFVGGEPRLVVPAALTSGMIRTGGADGLVAVVDQCEGHLTLLGVGAPDSAGVLAGFRAIDPATAGLTGDLVPATVDWGANGRSFIAVAKVVQPDDAPLKEPDTIVRVGLDGSVATLASAIGVIAAVELADGRLVRASNETVRVGNEPTTKVKVASLALGPDRTKVAVFGDDGVQLLVPGQPLRKLAGGRTTVGRWSPDGRLLAYLRLASDDVVAVDLLDVTSGDVVTVATRTGFVAPVFTADSSALLYDRAVDSGRGYDVPRATYRTIRR